MRQSDLRAYDQEMLNVIGPAWGERKAARLQSLLESTILIFGEDSVETRTSEVCLGGTLVEVQFQTRVDVLQISHTDKQIEILMDVPESLFDEWLEADSRQDFYDSVFKGRFVDVRMENFKFNASSSELQQATSLPKSGCASVVLGLLFAWCMR